MRPQVDPCQRGRDNRHTVTAGSTQLVVFQVAGREYGLPLGQVVEVLQMVAITPVPEAPPWVAGVINLRGRVIPMVDLRPRVGLPPTQPDPAAVFVVASSGERTVGVLADSVAEVVTVDASAIERPDEMTASQGLVTAVTRSEAGVALILDLDRLSPGPDVVLTTDH
jgi:purine-binding chemotaxis protein CheW